MENLGAEAYKIASFELNDIPLIEYGEDGMHFLMANDDLETSRSMPLLEKNLGVGNQTFSVKTDNVDFDLDSEKMIERLKHARKSPLFKKNGPSTQYTYCNPEYSKTLQFEESDWLFQVLQNTDYSLYLPDDVTDRILALPREAVRHDLEHIIKYHIGLTCDGVTDEYDPDGYAGTLSNSIILLGKFGNEDSFPRLRGLTATLKDSCSIAYLTSKLRNYCQKFARCLPPGLLTSVFVAILLRCHKESLNLATKIITIIISPKFTNTLPI